MIAPFKQEGACIRNERVARNLSLRDLAHMADISPAFLSGVENGTHRPSIAVAIRIMERLGVGAYAREQLCNGWAGPDRSQVFAWERAGSGAEACEEDTK